MSWISLTAPFSCVNDKFTSRKSMWKFDTLYINVKCLIAISVKKCKKYLFQFAFSQLIKYDILMATLRFKTYIAFVITEYVYTIGFSLVKGNLKVIKIYPCDIKESDSNDNLNQLFSNNLCWQ